MSNLDDIFQNHDQKRSKRQNPREHFNLCICSQKQEFNVILKEEFEDIKGVIRIRKSKKYRQHNDQKKKYKRTNDDLQNIHIKLKID
jgi:hypothetical protein